MSIPKKAFFSRFLVSRGPFGSSSGFALVIALSLMAFILLLLVSMLTLTQVEAQSVAYARAKLQARQNALLAVKLALGELNATLGPDQRVTARAEILDNAPKSESIENVKEPYWTGVWSTDPDDFSNANHENKLRAMKRGYSPKPEGKIKWLVSSPEANPKPSNHDRKSGDVPLLLVDKAKGITEKKNIYLPPVEISSASNQRERYAWWVADEGLKASFSFSESAASPITARRMVPEWTSDMEPLEALKEDLIPTLAKNPDLASLEIALQEAGVNDDEANRIVKDRFHDFTGLSYGVLSDVRYGGLKRDLTVAFGDDDEFKRMMKSHDQAVVPVGESGGHNGQLVFGFKKNRKEAFTAVGAKYDDIVHRDRGDPGGPPWAQLRDFFNTMPSSGSGASREFDVKIQTNTESGIYPVIAHFSLYLHPMFNVFNEGGEDKYQYRLILMPAVVLWNPYNAKLVEKDYSILSWAVGAFDPSAPFEPKMLATNSSDLPPNYRYKFLRRNGLSYAEPLRFDMTTDFKPGEAKLFIPQRIRAWEEAWDNSFGPKTGPVNELVDATSFGSLKLEKYPYFYQDDPDGSEEWNTRSPMRGGLNPRFPEIKHFHMKIDSLGDAEDLAVGLYLTDKLPPDSRKNNFYDQQPLQVFMSNIIKSVDIHQQKRRVNTPKNKLNDRINLTEETMEGDPSRNRSRLLAGKVSKSGFPAFGMAFTLRLLQNNEYPEALKDAGTLTSGIPDPQFAFLANFNPRGSRIWSNSWKRNGSSLPRIPVDWKALAEWAPTYYNYWNENPASFVWLKELVGHISGISDLDDKFVPIGTSDDPAITSVDSLTLFDLPSNPKFFQSLAALQHANLSPPEPPGYYLRESDRRYNDKANNTVAYYPTYAVGNSKAPVLLEPNRRSAEQTRNKFIYYDWSYLINHKLWDTYFFSASYDRSGEKNSHNSRMQVIDKSDEDDLMETFDTVAGNLLVKGAFNVNSTSVSAWQALLAGTLGAKVDGKTIKEAAPYLRNLDPLTGSANKVTEILKGEKYSSGFRTLDKEQIEALAKEIVKQVKKRGPFISMSHFVNRVIWDDDFTSPRESRYLDDESTEHVLGTLQAAIEADGSGSNVVNKVAFKRNVIPGDSTSAVLRQDPDSELLEDIYNLDYNKYHAAGSRAFGYPGYITQADILSRIGSVLSARSDTFKIRAYGDVSVGLDDSEVVRAWCELTVQRLPSVVDSKDPKTRRFAVHSMRWLTEDEV